MSTVERGPSRESVLEPPITYGCPRTVERAVDSAEIDCNGLSDAEESLLISYEVDNRNEKIVLESEKMQIYSFHFILNRRTIKGD